MRVKAQLRIIGDSNASGHTTRRIKKGAFELTVTGHCAMESVRTQYSRTSGVAVPTATRTFSQLRLITVKSQIR